MKGINGYHRAVENHGQTPVPFVGVDEAFAPENRVMGSYIPLEMELAAADRVGEMSDDLLIPAAKAGDSTAFQELSKRHANRLLRRIYLITRNWEDAEDVVQESILRAFVHMNRFEGRSTFSTWLTRIAINSALMELRRKRTTEQPMEAMAEDGAGWQTWDPTDTRENAEQQLVKHEREQLLNEAILRLRPTLRNVVQLKLTPGHSLRDIARILDISIPAVKSRLSRARTALRRTVP